MAVLEQVDWPALRRYWLARRARMFIEIDESLAKRGIWISGTLVSDPRTS